MSFDRLLRQNFWAVLLVLLGVISFAAARGVSALARPFVRPTAKELSAPPLLARSLPSGADASHETDIAAILERNIFDSAQGKLQRPQAVADDADDGDDHEEHGPIEAGDPVNAPICDSVKLLVAVASTDPEWSFASFEVASKPVLARRGQDVGGKNVEFIGWDRVWLSSGSTLCQTRLFVPEGQTPPPAPVQTADSGSGRAIDQEIAKGIKKNSPTDFDIDRSIVDKILENQAELMKTARIRPVKEGDKVKGVSLMGIRNGSVLQQLGMQNGDRLQTINGFDVSSPEKALEAYARLRAGADQLTVSINRDGTDMNIDYHIK